MIWRAGDLVINLAISRFLEIYLAIW